MTIKFCVHRKEGEGRVEKDEKKEERGEVGVGKTRGRRGGEWEEENDDGNHDKDD